MWELRVSAIELDERLSLMKPKSEPRLNYGFKCKKGMSDNFLGWICDVSNKRAYGLSTTGQRIDRNKLFNAFAHFSICESFVNHF